MSTSTPSSSGSSASARSSARTGGRRSGCSRSTWRSGCGACSAAKAPVSHTHVRPGHVLGDSPYHQNMARVLFRCESNRHRRRKGAKMRLANIRSGGRIRAARVDGDTLVVLQDELTDLLRRPSWEDLAGAAEGERVPAAGASFAPLVTKPDKIICAGLNYKAHIAETGRPVPEYPFFFAKFPAALIGA